MNSILTTVHNSRNWLLTRRFAAIDTEFKVNHENKQKPYTIFAASIVDDTGFVQFKHITDFKGPQPEKELVQWLMGQMLGFRLTLSWYGTGVELTKEDGTLEGKDSDLKIIDLVCKYYNIPSIIEFNQIGTPYVNGYGSKLQVPNHDYRLWNRFQKYYHIDLYKVFKKPLIKSVIYNNKYRSLGLDSVCRAVMGEGKLEGLDGNEVQKLSKEKQLEYVTQDASLVMKLSQYNNYEILDLMNAISNIVNIAFERVCHTGVSTWWNKIIEDKIINGGCRPFVSEIKKKKYKGGYVMEPKSGFYHKYPVYVLDVKSLYPSIMITKNISFDTVNCECCKDNPNARVDTEILKLINSEITSEEEKKTYWICKDPTYRGIVPRLLEQFRSERFRQLELGNKSMQLALKNLINSCYGVFGTDFFPFADYRVAELTTAYGRQILKHMQHISREVYDFSIIYGDTDSMFISDVRNENDIMKFIAECFILLDMDVEPAEIYNKFLITKKKHYIGILSDKTKEPIIKGMEGIKSDRPPWINKLQRQFADDIKYGKNPSLNIQKEYALIESGKVPLEDLVISLPLAKNPSEYAKNNLQRILGNELGLSQGDTLQYYKSNTTGGGTSNSNLLSKRKYSEMLRKTVEESLKLMGFDFNKDVQGQRTLT